MGPYAEKYLPRIGLIKAIQNQRSESTFSCENSDKDLVVSGYFSHITCNKIIFILIQSIELAVFIYGYDSNFASIFAGDC